MDMQLLKAVHFSTRPPGLPLTYVSTCYFQLAFSSFNCALTTGNKYIYIYVIQA